ncbi:MAG: lipopolysaccharide heptosyltransferase II [Nitrospirae bacterium]|nr:lipopolysaccharide heptosyltransferase II [Nitrospirota bacterium]
MDKQSLKILIRGVNWIGDAVLTIPAIRSIRHAFPDAHISLLVKPWVSEIFKDSPDINEIILYEDSFSGFSGKVKLVKKLRQYKFDMAILLQNAFDAALIAWLSGIPERIGYKRDTRGFLLTKAITVEKDILEQHQVYYYLNLLKSAGIESSDTQPYIYLSDNERQRAGNLLSSYFSTDNGPLIGVNPGATYGSAKRWLPDRFADLIIKIINELNGRVIIFGGPSEVEIADEIITEINKLKIKLKMEKYGSRILVMSGKTNLRELAALISECDIFITNDSGPMHMASALLVPIVAIFGSTNKTTTGPFGEGHTIITKDLPCAPCMKRECPEGHLNCMTDMTADEVFNAVKKTLPVNKAVFLDKDGTIIEDKNYLNSFDDLVILRGVKGSLKKLKEAGFKLIGITNQSGIARGIVDEKFVQQSNEYLKKELGIDDFYYCPHHPDEQCLCRKPGSVLPLKAKLKHKIDFKTTYVIGDKESDVLLAKKIRSNGILLSSTPLFENTCASYIAKDLNDAVKWILAHEKSVK